MKIAHIKKYYLVCLFVSYFFTIFNFTLAQEIDTVQTASIDSTRITIIKAFDTTPQEPNSETFYATVGEVVEKSFKVRILFDEIQPVKKFPVYFKIISIPHKSKGAHFQEKVVYTDVNGFADGYAVLGSKEGQYEFSARIKVDTELNDIVYFKSIARKSNWVFFLITGLIGGLGLFLFGMNLMSEGMKKTAGGKLRIILETLTNNRLIAVAVGTFITMVIQSSSATTVMLVSFVQAQLMTFAQSLGIILGSGIGTTITAQMIAFKLTDYALIFIGVGFVFLFLTKSKRMKSIGEVILGFGLLFFGMWVMSDAMFPLRTYQPFLDTLLHLENPILGILVGALFTAIVQSSSAFTGIIIILGTQGLVTLEAAIPLILGSNIGTSITAMLASIGTGREAKRVALAHTLFKLFGVLLFVWWIPYFADVVKTISPKGPDELKGVAYLAEVVPRQIANAHTVFNVVLTIILLPFTNISAKLIEKLLPDIVEEEESEYRTKYLEDSLISTPTLALNLAKAEVIRMAYKAQKMVEKILIPFFKNDRDVIEVIQNEEAELDYLNLRISKYLMKISQNSLNEESADEVFEMMHCITELEQIGDIVSKRLVQLAEKRMELNLHFSEEGRKEIEDYHLRTMKQMSRAIEVFKDVNLKYAKRMEKKYKKYRLMEIDLRRTHFDRLKDKVPESIETSGLHLELIDLLKRISSNATNIARIFLETKAEREKQITLKAELSDIEKKTKKNLGSDEIIEEGS